MSNPKGNLEHAPLDVLKDRLRSSLKPAEEIATLCNDCLAGDDRMAETFQSGDAGSVLGLAAVEQRHDDASVQKHGNH
jgi:hypothetical protein